MKKSLKAILTIFTAVALAFNVVPATADAAAPDNTGYLMYVDSSWTYQYWGEAVETGIVGTDVTITGAGEYTVGLDFTGTADGAASGLTFAAVGIQGGETSFPGYSIEINAIKINGEEIDFSKGYTSTDDTITTRMNILNPWVDMSTLDYEKNVARSFDGDLSDVSAAIIDTADFETVETVYVDFTLYDADGSDGSVADDADDADVEEDADDADVEDDADDAEEAAEEETTSVVPTGVVGLGVVYGLGALATGAVALKRKQK